MSCRWESAFDGSTPYWPTSPSHFELKSLHHGPTDGGFFHLAGVPMVNLLAAPMYLFDPADTVEMIHEPSLVPVSRAAARLVADAASWSEGRP